MRGFKPFLDTQAVDIVHPDLAFAGGLTGRRKIADYAALTRTPVALHNVGTLVLTTPRRTLPPRSRTSTAVKARSGGRRTTSSRWRRAIRRIVRKSLLPLPKGVGLGLDLNVDFLKKYMAEGETWWG